MRPSRLKWNNLCLASEWRFFPNAVGPVQEVVAIAKHGLSVLVDRNVELFLASLRVPKTLSVLMEQWNHLSWQNDRLLCFLLAVLASPFK
jgi:hypothetical protein